MDALLHDHEPHFGSALIPVVSNVVIHHEVEAPDQGVLDEEREAPEARPGRRHPEAPDAGVGRMSVLEHEFTHGRSQS